MPFKLLKVYSAKSKECTIIRMPLGVSEIKANVIAADFVKRLGVWKFSDCTKTRSKSCQKICLNWIWHGLYPLSELKTTPRAVA